MEEETKKVEKKEVKIKYESFMKIVIAVEVISIIGLLIYWAVR